MDFKIIDSFKGCLTCDYCEYILKRKEPCIAVYVSKEKFNHFGNKTFTAVPRSVYLCESCRNLFMALESLTREKKMKTTSKVVIKNDPIKPKFGKSDKVSKNKDDTFVLLCTSNIDSSGYFSGVIIHNPNGYGEIGSPFDNLPAKCYKIYFHSILLESK